MGLIIRHNRGTRNTKNEQIPTLFALIKGVMVGDKRGQMRKFVRTERLGCGYAKQATRQRDAVVVWQSYSAIVRKKTPLRV